MELKTAIEILEYHQEWRLGKRNDMIHEPKKLTEALDIILSEIKKEYDWVEIKTQGNPKDIKGVGLHPRYYVVLNGVVFDDVRWNFVHKQWQKPRYGHCGLEQVFPTYYKVNLEPKLPLL